jgi:hypothetical protein
VPVNSCGEEFLYWDQATTSAKRVGEETEAVQGDIEAAAHRAQDAMGEHDRLPMPFERARTQLLLGQL